jgi:hypothetical protein
MGPPTLQRLGPNTATNTHHNRTRKSGPPTNSLVVEVVVVALPKRNGADYPRASDDLATAHFKSAQETQYANSSEKHSPAF